RRRVARRARGAIARRCTMSGANPIDVVEAAYQLESDDRAWLESLGVAVRPLLEGGRGILAYRADPARAPVTWLDDAVSVGAHDEDVALSRQAIASAGDFTESVHRRMPSPLTLASELAGVPRLDVPAQFAEYMQRLGALGIVDNAAFSTVEPGGVS